MKFGSFVQVLLTPHIVEEVEIVTTNKGKKRASTEMPCSGPSRSSKKAKIPVTSGPKVDRKKEDTPKITPKVVNQSDSRAPINTPAKSSNHVEQDDENQGNENQDDENDQPGDQ